MQSANELEGFCFVGNQRVPIGDAYRDQIIGKLLTGAPVEFEEFSMFLANTLDDGNVPLEPYRQLVAAYNSFISNNSRLSRVINLSFRAGQYRVNFDTAHCPNNVEATSLVRDYGPRKLSITYLERLAPTQNLPDEDLTFLNDAWHVTRHARVNVPSI